MPQDDQSEIFVWVDENDKELGLITRKEAHGGSNKIHRGIKNIIFNQNKTKLLFQQRSLIKDTNPGKWSWGVGGHCNKGDTYLVTAKRELFEEIGVTSNELEFIMKGIHETDVEREMEAVFEVCISDSLDLHIDPTEVLATSWVNLNELKQFLDTHSICPETIKMLSTLGYI